MGMLKLPSDMLSIHSTSGYGSANNNIYTNKTVKHSFTGISEEIETSLYRSAGNFMEVVNPKSGFEA